LSIEEVIGFSMVQLAYQSFEADVKHADIQATIAFPKSQLAYQSFEADVKHASIPLTDVEAYAKLTYNVLRFAFLERLSIRW
jgi:hypothetical protein